MFPVRLLLIAAAMIVTAGLGIAATPKEIDAAVQKACTLLKEQYRAAKPGEAVGRGQGTGATALVGLALLESGVRADDPSMKAITAGIREAAITETQTYHIALCLLYLDRLGEAADEPMIQMLGVRLLAGQNARGGWTYACIDPVSPADERVLRASLIVTELKAGGDPPAAEKQPRDKAAAPGKSGVSGKLHPEVEKYLGRLASSRVRQILDDNSNTQFGVVGVWAARKHGLPAEHALGLIEKRFLATQNSSGGWPYAVGGGGSPSMTCAGLLGLATAIGRREERRLKHEPIDKENPFAKHETKVPMKPAVKGDDPFFNPPTTPEVDDPFFNPVKPVEPVEPPKKKQPEPKTKAKAPADARDAAVQRALASLGRVLTGDAPQGKGKRARIMIGDGPLGNRDFYFLWSLERVGVIFGLDKIGGVDWYDVGAGELVRAQNGDGSWGAGGRGSEVDTSFALLFLARSNLVRDLSTKVQRDASNTELRAGSGRTDAAPAAQPMSVTPSPAESTTPMATKPPPPITPPPPTTDDPKIVVAELLGATDTNWEKTITRVRDVKGTAYTQGLVLALHRLEGDRLKSARAALAERLTRMTAETLRTMVKEKDAELRRGAVLAMAMKDDQAHLPDLIAALLDEEEAVVRAAKAGLKSVTGQDFGPAAGANLADRTVAAKAWLDWLRKQK